MTDYGIEEIYGLVYEAFQGGQAKIQLQAFPFRMTTVNLARHDKIPIFALANAQDGERCIPGDRTGSDGGRL